MSNSSNIPPAFLRAELLVKLIRVDYPERVLGRESDLIDRVQSILEQHDAETIGLRGVIILVDYLTGRGAPSRPLRPLVNALKEVFA